MPTEFTQKTIEKKESLLNSLNRNLKRLFGASSLLTGESSETSFHLIEITNNSNNKETRVFNTMIALSILANLEKGVDETHLWKLLIATDPDAPYTSKHYNVTFVDEDFPYLEWRWIGGQIVQKRLVLYRSDRFFPWQTLKGAELYYQFFGKGGKGSIAEWLESIGFELDGKSIEKWKSFTPEEEVFLFSSTGPSMVCKGDELEINDKGWCRITRIEEVPSSSDVIPTNEFEEVISKWDEWLYFGYIIDPEVSEIIYN